MFAKLKKSLLENIDTISMGIILLNGGDYRPVR